MNKLTCFICVLTFFYCFRFLILVVKSTARKLGVELGLVLTAGFFSRPGPGLVVSSIGTC